MKHNSSMRRLRYTGMPYVTIKPYKVKIRAKSTIQDFHQKIKPLNEPPKIERRLPFLQNATIGFSEDEIRTINESINMDISANPLLRSPSRLQQIKLTHFESSQKPLAMDYEPSTPYFQPTYADNLLDLEKDNSLISLHGEDDLTSQLNGKSTVATSTLSRMDSPLNDDDEPVSSREIKNQVWTFCHDHQSKEDTIKAMPFNSLFEENTINELLPRGRRKLLKVIHKIADDSCADYFDAVPEKRIDAPIETTYCAQRMSKFLQDKEIPLPTFLETKNQPHDLE